MASMILAAAALLGTEMAYKTPQHLKPKKASDHALELGRKFAKISRAPLKRKGTSDAWNERQNRLTAGRMSADLLLKSAKLRGQGK